MGMELVNGLRLPYGPASGATEGPSDGPDEGAAPELPRPLGLREVAARALAAAHDGPPPAAPSRFYVLGVEAALQAAWHLAHAIEAEHGAEAARAAYEQWRAVPGWVVVTCRQVADAEAAERAREDTLTAVQRFTLQLWSDTAPSRWLPGRDAEAALFRLVGADPAAEALVGLIHFGHPEG